MLLSMRNDVRVSGVESGRPIVFVHGYGCDQSVWRFIAPDFEVDHKVVTFDHVGSGNSDLSAWDPERYATLRGYTEDVVAICRELELSDAVLVGHSVGAMISALAVQSAPELFGALVMVTPNPRHVDDEGYVGGFSREDVAGLLDSLDQNQVAWAATMAPVIMGSPERPELAAELTSSFCRQDPRVARQFARVAFLSDTRPYLPGIGVPTLVLQCREDPIVPDSVGRYVQQHVPGSRLVQLCATGHCPHLSAPTETTAAIRAFL